MDQLIPITMQQVADDTVQTVHARKLHAFLEVGKDFTNWIKDRIRQYGFVEGQGYVVFGSPILANQKGRSGDRCSKEYALVLDMAKEHIAPTALARRHDVSLSWLTRKANTEFLNQYGKDGAQLMLDLPAYNKAGDQ
ncbi:antA/AntB antirepressor family protein [Tepidicaulis sp. LMO-SS28]|uniref:antA/AntB antirepressor family protein n=1 Tax=Tepidicaulis sp. LMO-SS28 TaxID=3447455 RepID=UPI003EE0E824